VIANQESPRLLLLLAPKVSPIGHASQELGIISIPKIYQLNLAIKLGSIGQTNQK
jgi:hypothetical protein